MVRPPGQLVRGQEPRRRSPPRWPRSLLPGGACYHTETRISPIQEPVSPGTQPAGRGSGGRAPGGRARPHTEPGGPRPARSIAATQELTSESPSLLRGESGTRSPAPRPQPASPPAPAGRPVGAEASTEPGRGRGGASRRPRSPTPGSAPGSSFSALFCTQRRGLECIHNSPFNKGPEKTTGFEGVVSLLFWSIDKWLLSPQVCQGGECLPARGKWQIPGM